MRSTYAMEGIMRKIFFITLFVLLVSLAVVAQTTGGIGGKNSRDLLTSETVDNYGKEMDKMIVNWSKRIQDAITKYDLLSIKDIRILPYQCDYTLGDGFVEIERHFFIKDDAKRRIPFGYKDIQGIRLKKTKLYINGTTVTKIETDIQEKYFRDRPRNHVIIIDPSPMSDGTDDITFTHKFEGKTIIENKKLSEIKNNADEPLRNNIKREFLVPNLMACYNALMFIGEAYYNSLKDSEKFMENFLKESLKME